MDRDGTKDGFDIPLTRAVARAVPIPVIASGGVGTLEHFAEGVIDGEADAVLAASVFHFGTFTIRQVKEYMGLRRRLDVELTERNQVRKFARYYPRPTDTSF